MRGTVPKFIGLVAVDANVLDRHDARHEPLVGAFLDAEARGLFRIFLPPGVIREMTHPHAPTEVRFAAERAAVPPAAGNRLTARQHIDRITVRAILRGDGRPGKHDRDASHLSAAAEAGCSTFVTQDGKILRKRDVLSRSLPFGFRVVTLADFMETFPDPA